MKPFSSIAAFVFAAVAVLQLLRFSLGWDVLVNGWSIPLWASVIGFLVASALAILVWREAHR